MLLFAFADGDNPLGFLNLLGENQNCVFFAHPSETNSECGKMASTEKCKYLRLKSPHLTLIENPGKNPQDFVLVYKYVSCSGRFVFISIH